MLVCLADIQRAYCSIPNARHEPQVLILVAWKIAVMDVMHARTLQPAFEPRWVSERNVVVSDFTVKLTVAAQDAADAPYSTATGAPPPAAGRRTKKHRGINNTLIQAEA
jgi:hypothetical protein